MARVEEGSQQDQPAVDASPRREPPTTVPQGDVSKEADPESEQNQPPLQEAFYGN